MFKPAVRQERKLKMVIDGPTGSGKTMTAMRVINYLAKGEKWCVFDTENAADLYSGTGGFTFDHVVSTDRSPQTFIDAVVAAYKGGYAGLIIDSLSHEWKGCLEIVDTLTKKSKSKNAFTEGWSEMTPLHEKLFDVMRRAPIHIVATLRVKMDYEMQRNERTGKMEPVKIGLAPITGKEAEYEFDVVLSMQAGVGTVSKTRCPQLEDWTGKHPGEDIAEILRAWLNGELPATNLDFLTAAEVPQA